MRTIMQFSVLKLTSTTDVCLDKGRAVVPSLSIEKERVFSGDGKRIVA